MSTVHDRSAVAGYIGRFGIQVMLVHENFDEKAYSASVTLRTKSLGDSRLQQILHDILNLYIYASIITSQITIPTYHPIPILTVP
jgi:hypothetical protein